MPLGLIVHPSQRARLPIMQRIAGRPPRAGLDYRWFCCRLRSTTARVHCQSCRELSLGRPRKCFAAVPGRRVTGTVPTSQVVRAGLGRLSASPRECSSCARVADIESWHERRRPGAGTIPVEQAVKRRDAGQKGEWASDWDGGRGDRRERDLASRYVGGRAESPRPAQQLFFSAVGNAPPTRWRCSFSPRSPG